MKFLVDTKNLLPNILILGAMGLILGAFLFPFTFFLFQSWTPLWSSPLIGAGIGIFLWWVENVRVIKTRGKT